MRDDGDRRPVRTCVGCRNRRPQRELVRLYLDADRGLRIGRNGTGRGAWLCGDRLLGCFDTATASRAWGRAFRQAVDAESLEHCRRSIHDLQTD